MDKKIAFGLKFSVFNLAIVALLGTLMRYKIAYSFPFIDQKHMQESHSHFAFYGWITACIYILVIKYLNEKRPDVSIQKYGNLFLANFVAAYGMLFSFVMGGYNIYSIAFSILGILITYVFLYYLITDLKGYQETSKPWIIGGFFFAVLSSLGVFYLAYMIFNQRIPQDAYLATTYYYLHFQYNGFFIFASIGLFLQMMKNMGAVISEKDNQLIFRLLFVGCLVGYGLSVLWAKIPMWLYVLIVISTLMQTFGSYKLIELIKKNWQLFKEQQSGLQRFVVFFFGFAFMVKIALQLGSVVPDVNKFAFGFRNIVIAYLHLVLLMCISTFLIYRVIATKYFEQTKTLLLGWKLLLLGIFLNEFILGIMGIFSIKYIAVPKAPQMLLFASALMLISSIILWVGMKDKKEEIKN